MSTETTIAQGVTEPGDLEFVRTGAAWPYTFWQRDDEAALDTGGEEGGRWWDCAFDDGGDGPQPWEYLASLPGLTRVAFSPFTSQAVMS